MSYQAVSDRLIILPDKVEEKIGNILVPDSSKGKPKKGIVLSAGPDCREVKPGYEVLILEGHGALFQEDGQEKLVIKESDVLCYHPLIRKTDPEDAEFMCIRKGEHRIEIEKLEGASWGYVFTLISKDFPI